MILLKKITYPIFILLSLSIILFSSCSSDNSSSEPNTPESVAWESFINQNEILSSVYDKENETIWLGTSNGLLKLDATDLENIVIDKSFFIEDGLLSDEIYSIMLNESSNEVWIGTHSGISVYNISTKTFSSIIMEERLYSNHVNVIKKDLVSNLIYVGTDDGINIYDESSNSWTVFRFATGFSENYINDICIQQNQSEISDIWFGTNGGVFKKDNNIDEWFSFTENDGLIDNEVLSLSYDFILEDLYIGTRNGVSVLKISDNNFTFQDEITVEDGLSSNVINDIRLEIIPYQRGTYIYFATNAGVDIYQPDQTVVDIFKLEGLTSASVNNILYLDTDLYTSSITFGTDYGFSSFKIDLITYTILSSNKYFFGPYNSTDEVSSISQIGANGNILFFTSGKGLISYDTGIKRWNYYYTENEIPDNIESIYITSENIIWVGTIDGLYKYDQNEFILFNQENSGLPGDRIYTIFKDNNNDLWLGTNKGLAKYNESLDEWTVYDDENSGLPNKKVYTITYDVVNNHYWFGTKWGIARFDGEEEWVIYDEENGLTNEYIEKLQLDNDGNLWIIHQADDNYTKVTKFNLENENFETISASQDDLLSDIVYSIHFDSNEKELYFGTDIGVCSYNLISNEWKQYENSFDTKIYGMQLVENSNNEKEMWLATDSGVSVMREF